MAKPKQKTSLDRARADLENAAKVFSMASEIPQDDDHEKIYIIDAAAIPAAYYLRSSVQEALTQEIAKDYLLTGELAAGASLKNQVEARHGETDKVSDQENDNSERGAGSEDPVDSKDNGSGAGSSDPDPSGPRS